jgi:hypothetical protein
MLNDEHLLMTVRDGVVLEDGTEFDVDITVGQVRKYRADPNPCQCEHCQRIMIPAMRLLSLQEDLLAGRITEKQFERGLKQMGAVRGEKIQYN